jgi:hypothetical protein
MSEDLLAGVRSRDQVDEEIKGIGREGVDGDQRSVLMGWMGGFGTRLRSTVSGRLSSEEA